MDEKIRECFDEIKEKVRNICDLTDVSFVAWIKPLEFLEVHRQAVRLGFPGTKEESRLAEYVKTKFESAIILAIHEVSGCTVNEITICLTGKTRESKNEISDVIILKTKYGEASYIESGITTMVALPDVCKKTLYQKLCEWEMNKENRQALFCLQKDDLRHYKKVLDVFRYDLQMKKVNIDVSNPHTFVSHYAESDIHYNNMAEYISYFTSLDVFVLHEFEYIEKVCKTDSQKALLDIFFQRKQENKCLIIITAEKDISSMNLIPELKAFVLQIIQEDATR